MRWLEAVNSSMARFLQQPEQSELRLRTRSGQARSVKSSTRRSAQTRSPAASLWEIDGSNPWEFAIIHSSNTHR
jgi:hypothetical protein